MSGWYDLALQLMAIRRDINSVKGRGYYMNQRTKYLSHAKEAMASGDRVSYEYNLQYAEHFNRVMSEKFPQTVVSQTAQNIREDEVSDGLEPSDERSSACEITTAPKRYVTSPQKRRGGCRTTRQLPADPSSE